jgi:hypothetical protein
LEKQWRSDENPVLASHLWRLKNWEWENPSTCRRFAQAEVLSYCKHWDPAIQIYWSLTEQKPDQPLFLFQLATSLKESGQLQESLQTAKRCQSVCSDQDKADARGAALYLLGTVHKELGETAEMLNCWKDAAKLGHDMAVYEMSNYFSEKGDLQSWIQLHLATGSDVCSRAILRQSVLSRWHSTFSLAAETYNKTDFLIESYKKAIRLTRRSKTVLLTNCGSQFWLAKAYAHKSQRYPMALKLFRDILEVLIRITGPPGQVTHAEKNHLEVLTDHEIVVLEGKLGVNLAADEVEGIDDIFNYSRAVISLGKFMENHPNQRDEAQKLYQKVLKRAFASLTGDCISSNWSYAVGDALIALGNYEDGKWIAGLRCTAQTPHSDDSEESTDKDELAYDWDGYFCDSCAISSNYAIDHYVKGFLYKCIVCAEVELCEKCYTVFKDQQSDSPCIFNCKPNHEFLKIPGSEWSQEDSKSVLSGRTTPYIKQRFARLREMYRTVL